MMYAYKIMACLAAYTHRTDGATAIEYGLIASGISLCIAGAVIAFGDTLSTLFFDRLPGMLTQ